MSNIALGATASGALLLEKGQAERASNDGDANFLVTLAITAFEGEMDTSILSENSSWPSAH